MEIALKIIAVAFIGAAAYFYSIGETDWFFASIVLGSCSFFLSMRFGIKKRMAARAQAEQDEGDDDSISV